MNTRPVRNTGRVVAAAAVALAASAVFALPVLAGSASRGLAASQAPAGRLAPAQGTDQAPAIIIDSISPSDFARPGATVKVSGQFRGGASVLPHGLDVQLWSSGSPFTARSQLDGFAAGSYQPDSVPVATAPLPASVSPGQTVIWHASFKVDQVGMHAAFVNVYPLAAGVYDPAAGTQIAVERTFVPFWSGKKGTSGQPVRVAWVWPVIDQPHRGMCPAMLDSNLEASLDNGRLADLLHVGRDYASRAKLTWAVDPALLDDASAMTHSYQVLDGPECSQVKNEPASGTARSWLATLRAVTAGEPVFATPYGDPDVAALTHQGLDADLAAASSDGSAVAAQFLDRPDRTIAWPPDGIADAGVVDNLLVQGGSVQGGSVQGGSVQGGSVQGGSVQGGSVQGGSVHGGTVRGGIQTVVLDSGMMPPTNPSLYYTPDAVAKINTGVGKTIRVLLADHELTTLLAAGSPAARLTRRQLTRRRPIRGRLTRRRVGHRHLATIPRRDRHDLRRGAESAAIGRRGTAAALESWRPARVEAAQRHRFRTLDKPGIPEQPETDHDTTGHTAAGQGPPAAEPAGPRADTPIPQ